MRFCISVSFKMRKSLPFYHNHAAGQDLAVISTRDDSRHLNDVFIYHWDPFCEHLNKCRSESMIDGEKKQEKRQIK